MVFCHCNSKWINSMHAHAVNNRYWRELSQTYQKMHVCTRVHMAHLSRSSFRRWTSMWCWQLLCTKTTPLSTADSAQYPVLLHDSAPYSYRCTPTGVLTRRARLYTVCCDDRSPHSIKPKKRLFIYFHQNISDLWNHFDQHFQSKLLPNYISS